MEVEINPYQESSFLFQNPLNIVPSENSNENLPKEEESYKSKIANFQKWLNSAENELNPFNFEKNEEEAEMNYAIKIQDFRDIVEDFQIEYFEDRNLNYEQNSNDLYLKQQNTNLKLFNENLEKDNQILKIETTNLKNKLKKQDTYYKNQLQTLKIKHDDLDGINAHLSNKLQKLQTEYKNIVNSGVNSDLSSKTQSSDKKEKEDKMKLIADLEFANKKIKELETIIHKINKPANNELIIKELQQENENLKNDVTNLKKDNKNMLKKLNNIEKLKDCNNKINNQEQIIVKTEVKHENIKSQMDDLKAELQKWKQICENQEKDIRNLKNKAKADEDINEKCIENLKESLLEKEEELRSKMKDTQLLRELTKKVNELSATNKKLVIKNEFLEQKDLDFSSYDESMRTKINQLEIEKKSLESRLKNFSFELETINKTTIESIDKKDVEIGKLNENLNVINEKYKFYKKEYKNLKNIKESKVQIPSNKSERKQNKK